jgi:hypothetical protein
MFFQPEPGFLTADRQGKGVHVVFDCGGKAASFMTSLTMSG